MSSPMTPTNPQWLEVALGDLDRVLVDHAHCEHKAAAASLAFVSRYPDDPRLVSALAALARDEAGHFARLVEICLARGLSLGHPEPDPYVQELQQAVRKGHLDHRVDRLLLCAIIEGRSCERMRLLAEALATRGLPVELARLYDELWREEEGHHALFVELAERSLARAGVKDAAAVTQRRLDELWAHEAACVARLPLRAAIH